MAGKGGYQRPGKPAAVSGPGKYSKRTDGAPGDTVVQAARYLQGNGEWGDSKALNEIAQGAPLAAAPDVPVGKPIVNVVPFDVPTERPSEPITSGLPFGDGPGPSPDMFGMLNDGSSTEPDFVASMIRSAYDAYPSPGLRRLIKKLETEGR